MRNITTWFDIATYLSAQPIHTCINVHKSQVEHPHAGGLQRSLGLPVGQVADWRLAYPNCHGLHVREYADRYTAHIDRVNPSCDAPGHLAADAPIVGAGAALGAVIGLALGESAAAMLVGALIGGAFGVAAASAAETKACSKKTRA